MRASIFTLAEGTHFPLSETNIFELDERVWLEEGWKYVPARELYGVIDYEYYHPFSEYFGALETPFLSPLLTGPHLHPGLTTAFTPPPHTHTHCYQPAL